MQQFVVSPQGGFVGLNTGSQLFEKDGKKTAIIRFFAPVDGETVGKLLITLDQLMAQGAQQIILLLSSPGGSVFHGLSAYNYMKGLPMEITTVNFGVVDSIGVIMFCAGNKRLSVPNARFLLHGVQSQISGAVNLEEKQLEEMLKGMKLDIQNIARVVAEHTKKKEEEIYSAMVNRTTLDPKQAVDFGLAHEIQALAIPANASVISIQK